MHTSYYRLSENEYQEQFGLDFEHLQVGQRFAHRPGVTVSQQDNVDEALDTANAAMIHYDDKYAAQTSWQKPLMVSTITVQRLVGMVSKTFGRHRRIVAMDSIALSRPVFGGDTLYAESEIITLSAPDADADRIGLVGLRTRGINQRGETVATLDYTFEMWRAGCMPAGTVQNATPAIEPRFASHVLRDDGVWLEQTGLFFEDVRAAETFIHSPRRTVMAEEAVTHAMRSMLWAPQYHDLETARALGHDAPLIPQSWILTLCVALTTRTLGRVTANLGWTKVRFGAQVRAGDTIESRSTILEKRSSSSRPSEGIVTITTEGRNQRGEMVVTFERSLLVYKRDAPNPYAAAGY